MHRGTDTLVRTSEMRFSEKNPRIIEILKMRTPTQIFTLREEKEKKITPHASKDSIANSRLFVANTLHKVKSPRTIRARVGSLEKNNVLGSQFSNSHTTQMVMMLYMSDFFTVNGSTPPTNSLILLVSNHFLAVK